MFWPGCGSKAGRFGGGAFSRSPGWPAARASRLSPPATASVRGWVGGARLREVYRSLLLARAVVTALVVAHLALGEVGLGPDEREEALRPRLEHALLAALLHEALQG
eukprot:3527995-Prymnesium_polylepis.1